MTLTNVRMCIDVLSAVGSRRPPVELKGLTNRQKPVEITGLIDRHKKWAIGENLHISFLDGDPVIWKKVEEYALHWTQHANLTFDFDQGHSNPEIRISFKDAGSWSFIGTDANTIDPDKPTMNYGWLKKDVDGNYPKDEVYADVVIHEFGHAIGLLHEHQHPMVNIPWNKELVYQYYAGPPNNWGKQQVDHNLFYRYSKGHTQFSKFDGQSIMIYPVDKKLTDGVYEVKPTRALSPTDIDFIQTLTTVHLHGNRR